MVYRVMDRGGVSVYVCSMLRHGHQRIVSTDVLMGLKFPGIHHDICMMWLLCK